MGGRYGYGFLSRGYLSAWSQNSPNWLFEQVLGNKDSNWLCRVSSRVLLTHVPLPSLLPIHTEDRAAIVCSLRTVR